MTHAIDRVEAEIDRRSAAFKKELGLRDLVLTQVLFIVGLGWVGTAARVGPSHVVFWLLAILLFYITLGFAVAVVIGVGEQEAFQLLNNASGIFYALTYLVMFALPVAGFRGARTTAPLWLKLAACSGFLMTALYVALSIFPIVPVGNVPLFTTKITLVIVGTNVAGAALFLASRRRQRAIRATVSISG